jgi:hypothetical protein
MSVLKVIEVLSDSRVSWEDAAQQAIAKASGSVHNIKSIYIKDHSAKVDQERSRSIALALRSLLN